MTVGENIKQLRISRKWSQQKLADEIGLSRNYISELENNKRNLSITTLNNLADKLGVPIGLLIDDNNFIKQKEKDIEMWKRVLENHTNNLNSLQNLKDSNYHTDIMGLLTEIDNDLLKIIVNIDAGKLNLEGVKMELDTLQSGLRKVSYNTYDDMKVLDANIASNKNTIDLANRKLKELGYTSASNSKTDAD